MNEIVKDSEVIIENMIYEIRGRQVMLDSDLARLYEVETKRINEAVRNNPLKFPERFSWVLNKDEEFILRSKISTSNNTRGGRRYNSRVFTEQGVMMLATILKSNIATEITIRIMDAFVLMKQYVSNNLIEQKYINNLVLEDHDKIKLLENTLNKFEEKRKNHEIYFNGQIYDAYSKIYEIFTSAKKSLIIIDSYADNSVLDIVKRLKVPVTVITKKDSLLTKQDIMKYNKQYNNLKVVYDNTFHDRYFILDNATVYHCGASINRIGYKTFSITLLGDKEVCNLLIDKIKK